MMSCSCRLWAPASLSDRVPLAERFFEPRSPKESIYNHFRKKKKQFLRRREVNARWKVVRNVSVPARSGWKNNKKLKAPWPHPYSQQASGLFAHLRVTFFRCRLGDLRDLWPHPVAGEFNHSRAFINRASSSSMRVECERTEETRVQRRRRPTYLLLLLLTWLPQSCSSRKGCENSKYSRWGTVLAGGDGVGHMALLGYQK